MNDTPAASIEPTVGEAMRVPVVTSSSRQILQPEQTIVACYGGIVEVIFMRGEMVVMGQAGTVSAVVDGQAEMTLGESSIESRLVDIGHVKYAASSAVEVALNILNSAMVNGYVERKDIVDKLKSPKRKAK
jgi:hypothetical protein